jgi:hypothetical protein
MKWQSVIPHSVALVLALCGVTLLAQPAGTGTASVVRNAVLAASCSQAHVDAALDAVSAGGTVVIPAGTCAWTSAVTWTAPANVTVKGAGTSAVGGGDQTVITDNFATNSPLVDITVASTGTFRLTGVTFQGGSGVLKDNGMLKLNGPGTVLLDHLHIDMDTYSPKVSSKLLWVGGGIRGVLADSVIDLYGLTWIHLVNGTTNGDVEWAAATGFGTSDFFYIEDNQINSSTGSTVHDSNLTDCHTGGKFVVRFNTLSAAGVSQTHPTGHSQGDDRGCRAHENYGNLVTSPLTKDPSFAFNYNNSGGALVWGNSIDQVYKNIVYFNNCRTASGDCGYTQNAPPNGWGYCNGASGWDSNGTPNVCIDQVGRGQGDLLTGTYGTPNRVNSVSGIVSWPNQALEPVYEWSTTGDIVSGWGGNWTSNQASATIAANRDYYLHHGNSGCDAGAGSCTTGVGVGTLAQRPASCTTGVAYFATDQGSWNASTTNAYGVQRSGADGVLYTCTSTNTWTLYYTPYTYPHPLRGSN